MGKRGPAKTPTKILENRDSPVATTRRKRGEPDTACVRLECPKYVSAEGRKWWRSIAGTLYAAGITSRQDELALCLLANTIAEYFEAKQTRDELPSIWCTSEKGGVYQHPIVAEVNAKARDVLRLLQQFGMTPATRADVSALPKRLAEIDEKAEYFK